jgi:archaellum biogenesis ATPase FlaH
MAMIKSSVEVQKILLNFMLSNPTLYTRVQNIYNVENFDRSLKSAAKFLQEHVKEHSSIPNVQQINAVANTDLELIDGINDGHEHWFLEEFEQFTKISELERAILKAADLLDKGDFGPIEKLIKDAVQISLTRDLGINYFDDPRIRLMRLKDSNGQVSTGWKDIDKALFGGFNRGELNVFCGGPGAGKSVFLQNLGCNWVLSGLNGIYVTLELSAELVAMRLDSMITGISSKEIFKRLDDVELQVSMAGKKSGRLRIKFLPSGSTVNDIRAYVKELAIQENFKADFICVDYLDLVNPGSCKVDQSDIFTKDKLVSEELRNFSIELRSLFATASQLNRCQTLDAKVCINGKNTTLGTVKVGDKISSNNGDVIVTEVLPIIKQPVWEIVTKSGKRTKVSAKHKFPTNNGLKSLETGLSIGDKLSCSINNK